MTDLSDADLRKLCEQIINEPKLYGDAVVIARALLDRLDAAPTPEAPDADVAELEKLIKTELAKPGKRDVEVDILLLSRVIQRYAAQPLPNNATDEDILDEWLAKNDPFFRVGDRGRAAMLPLVKTVREKYDRPHTAPSPPETLPLDDEMKAEVGEDVTFIRRWVSDARNNGLVDIKLFPHDMTHSEAVKAFADTLRAIDYEDARKYRALGESRTQPGVVDSDEYRKVELLWKEACVVRDDWKQRFEATDALYDGLILKYNASIASNLIHAMPTREQLANVIDPSAWKSMTQHQSKLDDWHESLRKADAIIALHGKTEV